MPGNALAALDKAAAAYDYGDLIGMIESVRPIVDGALTASEGERADALRFLGIGLFLTERTEGAKAAFIELLRLRPGTRLNPTLVKPDVVAFFEGLRRENLNRLRLESRHRKHVLLNLLPPFGQIQNQDFTVAWVVGGAELLTGGAALFTDLWLIHFRRPDATYYDTGLAKVMRGTNWVLCAALATAYTVGVTNGLIRYYAEPESTLSIVPSGSGLALVGLW